MQTWYYVADWQYGRVLEVSGEECLDKHWVKFCYSGRLYWAEKNKTVYSTREKAEAAVREVMGG